MNIVPQICPQCGGPLHVSSDRRTGICDYCSTTFALEANVNADRFRSLVQSGMNYLRQGDVPNAEDQSKKLIDLDSARGEGWLLKAATAFDLAQAEQSFSIALSNLMEADRQEFAVIFKSLALQVWKKANQMLVREAGKLGTSRAAKQHYEIKAKAAQLSAFSIELFPLQGWEEEVTKLYCNQGMG